VLVSGNKCCQNDILFAATGSNMAGQKQTGFPEAADVTASLLGSRS